METITLRASSFPELFCAAAQGGGFDAKDQGDAMSLITNAENLNARLAQAKLKIRYYRNADKGMALLYRGRVVFRDNMLRGICAFLDGWIEGKTNEITREHAMSMTKNGISTTTAPGQEQYEYYRGPKRPGK